jgi:hypothetical protein
MMNEAPAASKYGGSSMLVRPWLCRIVIVPGPKPLTRMYAQSSYQPHNGRGLPLAAARGKDATLVKLPSLTPRAFAAAKGALVRSLTKPASSSRRLCSYPGAGARWPHESQ